MILIEALLMDENNEGLICQGTEDQWCPELATWQVDCPEPEYGLGISRFVCRSHMSVLRSITEDLVSAL